MRRCVAVDPTARLERLGICCHVGLNFLGTCSVRRGACSSTHFEQLSAWRGEMSTLLTVKRVASNQAPRRQIGL